MVRRQRSYLFQYAFWRFTNYGLYVFRAERYSLKFEFIITFKFLEFHNSKPTIAYIYQDNHGRHLKVTSIDTREKEFHLNWKQDNVESEAGLLIPVPYYGGAIVIGQEAISYHRVCSFKNTKFFTLNLGS